MSRFSPHRTSSPVRSTKDLPRRESPLRSPNISLNTSQWNRPSTSPSANYSLYGQSPSGQAPAAPSSGARGHYTGYTPSSGFSQYGGASSGGFSQPQRDSQWGAHRDTGNAAGQQWGAQWGSNKTPTFTSQYNRERSPVRTPPSMPQKEVSINRLPPARDRSPSPLRKSQHNPQFYQQSAQKESAITQVPRDQQQQSYNLLNIPREFLPPEPDPRTFTPLLPPKERRMQNRITLVLDLDETLVHSSFTPVPLVDILIDIELDGQMHTVYVRKRPYVDEFLRRMSELFEVVVLTASIDVYADPVLDELDAGCWVHHRLFRDSCANLNGNYIKDLSYLGRPLHQTIIIDNCPTSYLFQPRNAIPISSWYDDHTDTELKELIPVLERAAKTDNVYAVLDSFRQSQANGERWR